jgi:hypothetical protein
MSDAQGTIGMAALLDEVDRDIDELRKKHPSDYGVKNLTMWWSLEKERLVTRHGPATAVRKPRRGWIDGHTGLLLLAGAVTWVVGEVLLLILRR